MASLKDPIFLTTELLRCASITPNEAGVLSLLQTWLEKLGFNVKRPIFHEDGTQSVENLYARFGKTGKHLMFAGHTDVVPVGDEDKWRFPPFAAEIADNKLYGRGAVDMKGGIACFIAAFARYSERSKIKDSISLLITNDEEGPAINGSVKLLKFAHELGEKWDAAILGEPTNPNVLGEIIKNGRRGSFSGIIKIVGQQGHVAYPERANNPIPLALKICDALKNIPLDAGNASFQPSNLEITSIDTDNNTPNIIPAKTSLRFNIRYNDLWDIERLKEEILNRVNNLEIDKNAYSIDYEWLPATGGVFLTKNDNLIKILSQSIHKITGNTPKLSTSGGTSDARFIKDYCPVVEFGLVGQTMHMVDECVAIDDLENLTKIYTDFMESFFQ